MIWKTQCRGKATDYKEPVRDHTGAPANYEFGFDYDPNAEYGTPRMKLKAKDYRGMPLRPDPDGQLLAYLACWDKDNFERLVCGQALVRRGDPSTFAEEPSEGLS